MEDDEFGAYDAALIDVLDELDDQFDLLATLPLAAETQLPSTAEFDVHPIPDPPAPTDSPPLERAQKRKHAEEQADIWLKICEDDSATMDFITAVRNLDIQQC